MERSVTSFNTKKKNREVQYIERKNEADKNGEKVPWEEKGVSLIAIGGDKLSRGLTLEGLSVSYYLRSSRMYDTLMQMGRWFGYRDGYNDLCRIFISAELHEWFQHITLANAELKQEFDHMELMGFTPEQYGLKVRSHPGQLMVTSAGKRRHSENLSISFGGTLNTTRVFDTRQCESNKATLERLVRQIGRDPNNTSIGEREGGSKRYHWEKVSPEHVKDFLTRYQPAPNSIKPSLMVEYIDKQLPDELKSWHVVLVSNSLDIGHPEVNIEGYEIAKNLRKPSFVGSELISVNQLTSPGDLAHFEGINLTDEARLKYKEKPALFRKHSPPEEGLLMIYLPYYDQERDQRNGVDGIAETYGVDETIVAFSITFPHSEKAVPVEYTVNSVYSQDMSDQ